MAAPPSLRRRRNAKAPSSSSSSRNSGSGGSGSKKKKTASSSSSSKRTHGGTAHERRRFVFAAAAAVGLLLLASLLLRRSAWGTPGSRSDDEDDGEGALQLALQLQNDPVLNKTHWYLTTFVCSGFAASSSAAEDNEDRGGGYCHPDLVPVPQRRTHRARGGSDGGIKSGETILILPRSQQIWDLDALRDPWVRRVLLRWDDGDEENVDDSDGGANTKRWRSPRHAGTSNPLDSGAYLAAYLVRRLKVAIGSWWRCNNSPLPPTSVSGETTEEEGSSEKDSMLPYLELLPNHTTLSAYHPTLWPSSDLDGLLGKHTSSRQLVQAYKTMMDAEYDVFSATSINLPNGDEKNEFARCISREEYRTMRIHVMSRSFGPGPPGPEEEMTSPPFLPSSSESASDSESMSLDEELDLYQTLAGINLTKGCRAMSPILDTWDHHAQPNVEWRYDRTRRAFVVKTIVPSPSSPPSRSKEAVAIPSGHDVMVSYGKYTDAHLFAKFGFNNGDGSGHVQVNLGSWHRMLDVGLGQQFLYLPFDYDLSQSQSKSKTEDGGGVMTLSRSVRALLAAQKRELTRYLQFDDGYDECIRLPSLSKKHHSSVSEDDNDSSSSSSAAWELKQLKFRHLQRIANDPDRWTVLLPPRRPHSKPAKSSNVPIAHEAPPKFDLTKKGSGGGPLFDMSKVASTCRLLTLTEHDFDGRAVEVLSEALYSSPPSSSLDDDESKPRSFFTVERQSDALEYRTLLCLSRLAGVALSRYPSTAAKDAASMPDLTERDFGGRERTATHVRLGELHGLEAVRALAVSFARTMRDRAAEELGISNKRKKDGGSNDDDRHPLLSMRDKPCPQEYLAPLLAVV